MDKSNFIYKSETEAQYIDVDFTYVIYIRSEMVRDTVTWWSAWTTTPQSDTVMMNTGISREHAAEVLIDYILRHSPVVNLLD